MAQNNSTAVDSKINNKKAVKYNKWGYFFLIPFGIAFIIYQLIPLCFTVYNSFFENYRDGLTQIGPNFKGLGNYIKLFSDARILKYTWNTFVMWIIGFIPQIVVSLILAQWFSDNRLKIKGSRFFKTVIYMPNLIMASAFSMLFFSLFAQYGPINDLLEKIYDFHYNVWINIRSWQLNIAINNDNVHRIAILTTKLAELKVKLDSFQPYDFFAHTGSARGLVALMNFLMWFGNTTILLIAGILGIDQELYEAAEVDGANSIQRFTRITIPLLKPILMYVVITSLIGGIQMFDVPQILSDGGGSPATTTMTLIMYLNQYLTSKNYGMGGALSVILFVITGGLSLLVYYFMYGKHAEKY